jgi:hypothetical protein
MINHAQSVDDWRPGFAKRASNFDEVCERASAWRWELGVTIWRIEDAVMLGARDLRPIQRLVLLHYVRRLNQEQLENNIACVWPSSARIAGELGCSENTLRGHRKGLEALGYMVRDYNRANRPADVEAFDLAPLVARLAELEANADAFDAEFRANRSRQAEHVVAHRNISAQAPETGRLEQSQPNLSSSVRGDKDAAQPRHSPDSRPSTRTESGKGTANSGRHRQNRQPGANGSSGGASVSGGASSDPSVYAEMVRQELRSAAKVCPRLAPLVTPALLANPLSATPEDAARVAAAAADLLPHPDRNNDQTAMWGWRKHGARVLVMLAIAVEDADVRSPCGYFGKLTGQDLGASDLRLNLARILKAKGEIPSPEAPNAPTAQLDPDAQALRLAEDLVAPPGSEDPKWQAIAVELRRILREGKFGSWFGRVGFAGVTDGVLTLSTPSSLVAERIRALSTAEQNQASAAE